MRLSRHLPALALALALVGGAQAAPVCTAPSPTPRLPTVSGWGDSIMFGVCSGGPLNHLVTLLPGYWPSNRAVSGENAAQIRARWTAEEATSCYGQRCGIAWIEGGVNSLRGGVTPAATLADMVWVVDDALSKGYYVVWLDVAPYAGFSGAGVNPLGQATGYNTLWAAACAARASNPRLRCVSTYPSYVDPANPGYMLPAYTCDGIHHTAAGGLLMAQLSKTAVETL